MQLIVAVRIFKALKVSWNSAVFLFKLMCVPIDDNSWPHKNNLKTNSKPTLEQAEFILSRAKR